MGSGQAGQVRGCVVVLCLLGEGDDGHGLGLATERQMWLWQIRCGAVTTPATRLGSQGLRAVCDWVCCVCSYPSG